MALPCVERDPGPAPSFQVNRCLADGAGVEVLPERAVLDAGPGRDDRCRHNVGAGAPAAAEHDRSGRTGEQAAESAATGDVIHTGLSLRDWRGCRAVWGARDQYPVCTL